VSAVTGLVLATSASIGCSMVASLFEATLYSVPMSSVRAGVDRGERRWVRMQRLKANPARPIAAILITNTIANTAGATMAGAYAQQVFNQLGVSIFSACLVLGILWFSEILPKTVGVVYCNQIAPLVARPIQLLVTFWMPIIVLTEVVTKLITQRADTPTISEWELAALMRQGVQDGTLRPFEARIVESVLRLDNLRVKDVMTPRTVMVSAPAELTLAEAAKRHELWQHGRVPVYEDEPDKVVGLVLRRDVLLSTDRPDRTLREIASDVLFVPELMRVDQLLDKLIAERRHLALVVDEYGQVEGLVTLEDVLEALIGQPIVDDLSRQPDLREKAERLAEIRREQLGVSEPDQGSMSDNGGEPTT